MPLLSTPYDVDMNTPQAPATSNSAVALYWDFEHLHAALCEAKAEGTYSGQDNRFRVQEPLVNVQVIMAFAATLGTVAINRAYCNWQYFGRYREVLMRNAMELTQLFPPGSAGKNGADIKLCLDAMEDLSRYPHLGTVLVVGGDSDFIPLAQKVRASGRQIVGIGERSATNAHWAGACHSFRYYDELVGGTSAATSSAS